MITGLWPLNVQFLQCCHIWENKMLPIKPQKFWPIWAHWLDPSTVMAPHKSPCCDMAADSHAAAINPQTSKKWFWVEFMEYAGMPQNDL